MRRNLDKTLVAMIAITLLEVGNASAALVGHWTLDNDTTGLQNLGTDGATSDLAAPVGVAGAAGGPTFTPAGGRIGGYATFNGNQALFNTTAGNAADDLTAYPFTYTAWIRPTTFTGNRRGAAVSISDATLAASYMTMGIETPTEGMDVQAVRRNTTFFSTEGAGTHAAAFDGAWHHVVAVFASDADSRLYLDGVQVGQSTTAATFPSGANAIGIGAFRRSSGFVDQFFGDVDDVRLYDQELTGQEIQALASVPEPAALMMMLVGGASLGALVRQER